MVTTRTRLALASAALAAVLAGGYAARAQQGVAERVGEAIDGTGRAIRRGVQGTFARTRATVHGMEVLDRVYSRIHWERTLTGSVLELEVQGGGIIVLRGVLPDAEAKAKAITLARDTVGVIQVIDQLSVASPPTSIPAPATPIALPEAPTATP